MKHIIILLVFSVFCSCKKEPGPYEKDILGEWIFVREYTLNKSADHDPSIPPPPPPIPGMGKAGFRFIQNGILENKNGYYEYLGKKIRDDFSGRFIYLGNRAKYEIEDDSLRIYGKNEPSYAMKISEITKDTLTLITRDSFYVKFARLSSEIYKEPDFDQVIVANSGTFGSFPCNYTMISANGNVVYYGSHYNTVNGFYTAEINDQQWKSIKESFQKCNLSALDESYDHNVADCFVTQISFLKNGKIVKTISDYCCAAPPELIWAYRPVSYLYQSVKLKKRTPFPEYADKDFWGFSQKKKEAHLYLSESFYLNYLLSSATVVNVPYPDKYQLHAGFADEESGTTDGRYFGFTLKDGKKIVLDLGFNFIEENKLQGRLKKKTD